MTDRHRARLPARSGALTDKGFRLDIQGIRGFALVLVLACHAGLPWAEGGFVGLDVFFVLSGFLITGLLLAEVQRTGRLSLLKFYGRRARRLLPLAITVLAVIVAGSSLLFGSLRSFQVAGDVVAASLYFANWRFMSEAVDYFAFDDPAISPVQHYWSLSVEEQFYLLWPLLIVAVLASARRRGWRPRALLWPVVASLTLASFAYGVWFSHMDSQQAYFSTLGRVWQLGVGCMLALALPAGLRLARPVATLLGAGGLAVLAWATIAFQDDIPYPGWYGLLPTLAAAAIIVAGTSASMSWPIRALCTRPMQYLGRISYAWYLWHWPALVFAAAIWGDMSPVAEVGVTLAAWLPAIVSHHLIEEPFRHSRVLARRPRRAIAFGLSCTAAAVGLGLGLAALQTTVPTARGNQAVGARAVDGGEPVQRTARALSPDVRRAEHDRGLAFRDGCHLKNTGRTDPPRCVYGDRRSGTTVVNFGDSHGLQYFPAMRELSERREWRLVNLTRAGCTVADVEFKRRCDEWRRRALARIEREGPDLVVVHHGTDFAYEVVTGGERLGRRASWKPLEDGLLRTLRRLRATGARVVLVRDIASAPPGVLECVADNVDDLRACAFVPRRSEEAAFDARAARRVPGVDVVDPLEILCPDGRCPAVMGNVVVYRNAYHLTATFARTLAPWLGRRLPEVGE